MRRSNNTTKCPSYACMHAACVHTPARIDRSVCAAHMHARPCHYHWYICIQLAALQSHLLLLSQEFILVWFIISSLDNTVHRQILTVPIDGINSCCRCKLQQVRAAGLLKPMPTGVNAPSKYTSTTNVLPRAYRGRPGDARRGGRRAQAAPRTRVGVWTTCPPHVHRLRASLACLPSPTASAFGRRSGVDDWTRARRCWLLTDWATAVLAAAKYFSGIHAMHGTGEGGRLALLRLHCYFFLSPSSLLIHFRLIMGT